MKAHEVVMAWVTDELASGRLHVGDHLPSERTLAETLGISRSSVRETMRVLESLGTIRTSTGSGPRSGTIITAAPEQALTLALNLQLATRQVDHHHIFETRLLLETWAAEHSDPAFGDWESAERLLDFMDDELLPVEDFLPLDAEFHVVLSRAADNPLISTLMDALRLSIADHTLALAHAIPEWATTSRRLRREHRDIFTALREGDREVAAERIQAHIRGYYFETSAAGEAAGNLGAPATGAE
ncbi:FadR/GntR family transcriptional regulator [Gulosibacter sp. ACHW.36C]|uniref:GntR family transcriptional regulator n=1 Tax=Gulosibacter sediminis TaxID=1729695 RepID=A0ABY4N1P7_9MICO|nr:FCD domain-containing protein [Gulosibacter sediminis]UQN15163.1 GntR family transcriptional regulator [Gulosibacter sediminis]